MKKDYREDFEAWARDCVKIADKQSGLPVPFVLNAPQRRMLALMEEQRRQGLPVRIIVLKARQWGCSTLVEIYMAWMQLVRHTGWNSLICAHVKDASAGIKGMYSRLLRDYPDTMKTGDKKGWCLSPYEQSRSVSTVPARDCTVSVATALSPNSARGFNIAMAHLSEVAFWADGDKAVAAEIVRTVGGTVSRLPDTVVVMESTANGKDNYFHDEWMRAVKGKSDKAPLFVPWHEIERYRLNITQAECRRMQAEFDDYELGLLAGGIEPERVAWYHRKRLEYPCHEAMMAEFPSTPEEAFSSAVTDPLIDPSDVAPVTDIPACRFDTRLCIALCSPQIISVFGISRGVVHPLADRRMSVSYDRFAREVARTCSSAGMKLVIGEMSDSSGLLHAPYVARRVARAGVNIAVGEDEEEFFLLDGSLISLCADIYSEGSVAEHSDDARKSLLRLSASRPGAEPEALTRIVAAYTADSLVCRPLCAADFIA